MNPTMGISFGSHDRQIMDWVYCLILSKNMKSNTERWKANIVPNMGRFQLYAILVQETLKKPKPIYDQK